MLISTLEDMSTIPEQDIIYKDCIHEFVVVFILNYVDNTGVRSNCETVVKRFHTEVRIDDHIVLNFTGRLEWFLGVRYSYDEQTDMSLVIRKHILKIWSIIGLWMIKESSEQVNSKQGQRQIWRKFQFQKN
jgi:hypothetical protein